MAHEAAARTSGHVLCVWPDRLRPAVSALLRVGLGAAAALLVGDWGGSPPDVARTALAMLAVLAGLLAGGVALGAALSRRALTVGTDGVAIGLDAPRFVSYADVDRLERDRTQRGRAHHLAVLVLRSGERLSLGSHDERVDDATLTAVGVAQGELAAALEHHRRERHRATRRAEHAALLACGPRSPSGWLDELRARTQPGGFRETTLGPAELLAVVEDPTADASAQAGAAYALRAQGLSDDGRARVRLAARATAAPRVRVALEAIAESLDEARVTDAVADAARTR